MFIFLISIAFLHAENMPQDLESIIKSIKSSNLYYDKVSSFDDKQIIAPLDFKRLSYNNENELLQAIKTTTDDNNTAAVANDFLNVILFILFSLF